MEKRFTLVFDDILKKQLDKSAKDKKIQEILTKMFNKVEFLGPLAGELLDSQEFIYEIKNKHPPIHLMNCIAEFTLICWLAIKARNLIFLPLKMDIMACW